MSGSTRHAVALGEGVLGVALREVAQNPTAVDLEGQVMGQRRTEGPRTGVRRWGLQRRAGPSLEKGQKRIRVLVGADSAEAVQRSHWAQTPSKC